jgi:LPS-assembly lipoprotein
MTVARMAGARVPVPRTIRPLPRRALLTLAAAATLMGCGFQPVYMPTASGQAGPAARDLAAVYVTPLGERPGMLLRQALQDRLEGTGDSVARRYDLSVSFWLTGEGLGIQPDTTATRVRLVGHADWVLSAKDPGHSRLTSGSARAADAMNLIDSQFFALDLESEIIQRRFADQLADQITLQVASYFRRRAAAEAAGLPAPAANTP